MSFRKSWTRLLVVVVVACPATRALAQGAGDAAGAPPPQLNLEFTPFASQPPATEAPFGLPAAFPDEPAGLSGRLDVIRLLRRGR